MHVAVFFESDLTLARIATKACRSKSDESQPIQAGDRILAKWRTRQGSKTVVEELDAFALYIADSPQQVEKYISKVEKAVTEYTESCAPLDGLYKFLQEGNESSTSTPQKRRKTEMSEKENKGPKPKKPSTGNMRQAAEAILSLRRSATAQHTEPAPTMTSSAEQQPETQQPINTTEPLYQQPIMTTNKVQQPQPTTHSNPSYPTIHQLQKTQPIQHPTQRTPPAATPQHRITPQLQQDANNYTSATQQTAPPESFFNDCPLPLYSDETWETPANGFMELLDDSRQMLYGIDHTPRSTTVPPSKLTCTHHCQCVDKLLADMEELREGMRSLRRKMKKQDQSSDSLGAKFNGFTKEELELQIAASSTPSQAIGKLANLLFAKEELMSCSVLGLHTNKSAELRPALDTKKREMLENLVVSKYNTDLSLVRSKLRDKLKNIRKL